MAIINFGGTVSVAQNFTADAERLKQVVRNVKFSSVSPNQPVEVASLGMPQFGSAEANFGARTLLLALRSVAKNLASVPGRKSLVLLTAGFSIDPHDPDSLERQSELLAVISACNRANVAIYPIDVRGLDSGITAASPGSARLETSPDFGAGRLVTATLHYDSESDPPAKLVYVQRGGTGGGSVGAGGGGTRGGAREPRVAVVRERRVRVALAAALPAQEPREVAIEAVPRRERAAVALASAAPRPIRRCTPASILTTRAACSFRRFQRWWTTSRFSTSWRRALVAS